MSRWSPDDVPDLTGRRVLVTGAADGVGRDTALALAEHGATLVLADHDLDALADVVRRADAAGAPRPVAVTLDLLDRDSVTDAADRVREVAPEGLDVAVLHARHRAATTPDGEDAALTARVLSPYLLLVRLEPLLRRVVTVVPPTHRLARDLGGPDEEAPAPEEQSDGGGVVERLDRLRRRTAWGGSAEAALGSLLLALELDARARAHGSRLRSVAAIAGIDVQDAVDRVSTRADGLRGRAGRGASILDAALGAVEQRADVAHHPVLMAATADLPGSTVVGLGGALGLGTSTRIVNPPRPARDPDQRRRVWDLAVDHAGADPWA